MEDLGDSPGAKAQLVDCLQIPLDGPYGQSAFLPQGNDQGDQGDQVDPQPPLTPDHSAQVRLGGPPPLTYWADTGHEDVLRDFRRSHRDLDDFPGPLGPSPSQARTTIGTGFQDMFHPVGRRHALAGKPMGTGLS